MSVSVSVSVSENWQLLHSAFVQNRLSHAYLLSGVPGLGKTEFAKSFSAFLLCENPCDQTPCGRCRGCTLMRAETHPDFLLIQPQEKSHSIKIDQIREFSEKINHTAHCGGYQVVIISPADAMPNQAANALLKTLEEPTGKVILFLIDDQRGILPSTIASRCQKIFFSSDHLDFRMHDNALTLRDYVLHHLQKMALHRANAIAFNPALLKMDMDSILQQCLLISSDLSRVQMQVSQDLIVNHDLMPILSEIAAKISPAALQQWMQKCVEKKSILSRGMNLNAQLVLEDIFIAWENLC